MLPAQYPYFKICSVDLSRSSFAHKHRSIPGVNTPNCMCNPNHSYLGYLGRQYRIYRDGMENGFSWTPRKPISSEGILKVTIPTKFPGYHAPKEPPTRKNTRRTSMAKGRTPLKYDKSALQAIKNHF